MSFPPFMPTLDNDGLEIMFIEPTLTASSAASMPLSQKRKQPAKREGNGPGVSQRGRNWNERDSILLVQAYQYSEERKSRTEPLHTHLIQ